MCYHAPSWTKDSSVSGAYKMSVSKYLGGFLSHKRAIIKLRDKIYTPAWFREARIEYND